MCIVENQRGYERQYSIRISESLKNLLQNKHLYQNVKIDFTGILPSVFKEKAIVRLDPGRPVAVHINKIPNLVWYPRLDSSEFGIKARTSPIDLFFAFPLPTIKIYCEICDREEPYNPYNDTDFGNTNFNSFSIQIYLLQFICQSCKKYLVSFMVIRDALKLSIVGRNPIEISYVPDFYPKKSKKYISDAIVAYNCGYILPGLFMLRTFIEQYLRDLFPDTPKDKLSIEILFEKYAEILPDDFKDRFPSLYKIYSEISIALHSANPDDKLFNESKSLLNEHFDAKRLFKIEK